MKETGESNHIDHQPEGTRIRRVIAAAAGLLLVLAVAHIALWLFFQASSPSAPTEAVTPPSRELLAGPRLQTDPIRDLEKWEAAQNTLLNSYGWVDREAGIVRIPIERAMTLVVEQEKTDQDND